MDITKANYFFHLQWFYGQNKVLGDQGHKKYAKIKRYGNPIVSILLLRFCSLIIPQKVT